MDNNISKVATVIPLSNEYAVNIDFIKSADGSPVWYSYQFGNFLVALYNIDINYIAERIIHVLDNFNINTFIEDCFDSIGEKDNSKKPDLVITVLLLNDIKNEINALDKPSKQLVLDKIGLILENLVLFKSVIQKIVTNNLSTEDIDMLFMFQQQTAIKFFPDKNGCVRASYSVIDIYSLFFLDFLSIQYHHILIKYCENCGDLFIPQNRSDEIYCDRVFKAGKTCKQIGYSIKEKNDPFKNVFTKARKTQHARIRYNTHIKDYKKNHYEPWLKAAQKARDEYRSANDIDGFNKWLEDNKDAF